MKTQWMLETNSDPLGVLRKFVDNVWQQSSLEGMLVSTNSTPETTIKPRLLEAPEQLNKVNPFIPLMTVNAAKLVPDLMREHPQERLGAMLRPCEMRTLIEMVKHDSFTLDDFLTICVDCLGTFPAEDFQWRVERKGNLEKLTQEALQFARLGGMVAYRYRAACQVCTSQGAHGADLNVGVLGLPVRQHLLVTSRDEATAECLHLDKIANSEANPSLVAQHERFLTKLAKRNSRIHERAINALADSLPKDVDTLVSQLESCGSCQDCLDECPVCLVDYPRRGEDGRYVRDDIARWMVSCAGCGMCEQICPKHLPLNAIFIHIRQQLAESLDYSPGYSLHEPLPL